MMQEQWTQGRGVIGGLVSDGARLLRSLISRESMILVLQRHRLGRDDDDEDRDNGEHTLKSTQAYIQECVNHCIQHSSPVVHLWSPLYSVPKLISSGHLRLLAEMILWSLNNVHLS